MSKNKNEKLSNDKNERLNNGELSSDELNQVAGGFSSSWFSWPRLTQGDDERDKEFDQRVKDESSRNPNKVLIIGKQNKSS